MTEAQQKLGPMDWFKRAMAIQREGADAAKKGFFEFDCPYQDRPDLGDFDATEWRTGFNQYQQEKRAVKLGYLEYCSTDDDGHGWRVPLKEAVESGRHVPRYYPLPEGMTAANFENYSIEGWEKYRVEGMCNDVFSRMSIKSTDDFDR